MVLISGHEYCDALQSLAAAAQVSLYESVVDVTSQKRLVLPVVYS